MPDALPDAKARPPWSNAYSDLIGSKDGKEFLVGAIAYALYKKQKIEFIRQGDLASDDPQVRRYHAQLTPSRVESLLEGAEQKLEAFADQLYSQITAAEIEQIRAGAVVTEVTDQQQILINGLTKDVSDATAAIKAEISSSTAAIRSDTRPWKVITFGVLSALAFALILTALRVVSWQNPLPEIFVKDPPPHTRSGPAVPQVPETGIAPGEKQ